jgi:hypothetical protein
LETRDVTRGGLLEPRFDPMRVLGVSATINSEWRMARASLYKEVYG